MLADMTVETWEVRKMGEERGDERGDGEETREKRDYQLVGLLKGRLLDVEAIGGNVRQGAVVEDDDGVCILDEPTHGEDAVVRVDDDVAGAACVGEDGVGLDDLLGEAVVEAFEEKRAEAGAGAAGDGVQQHEALEGVAAVGFAVDHLHDLLVDGLARLVAIAPVVAGADAVFCRYKNSRDCKCSCRGRSGCC